MSLQLDGTIGVIGPVNEGFVTATGSITARNLDDRFADVINVKDFGAVGDWNDATQTGTDDTAAIQAAINAAIGGGTVFFPKGSYRTTATLTTATTEGNPVKLLGVVQQTVQFSGGSRIVADHLSGPVVRFMASDQGIENLLIISSNSRYSATPASGNNFGILVESLDLPAYEVRRFSLKNTSVRIQPSHGFVSSGYSFMFTLDNLRVQSCKGHGCIIDGGLITGRTNIGRVGGHLITQLRTFNVNGHPLVLGSGLGNGFAAYRCAIIDADLTLGTLDPTIPYGYYGPFNSVIYGESIYTQNLAFGGPNLVGGAAMLLMGWQHQHYNNRYLEVESVAEIRASDVEDADNFFFENAYTTQSNTINTAIRGVDSLTNICQTLYWRGHQTNRILNVSDGVFRYVSIDGRTQFNVGQKDIVARKGIFPTNTSEGITITRTDFATGILIERIGVGATTGRLDCAGGTFQVSSDANLVLTKTAGKTITVKSNTINMALLPTSSSTLVSGDLWNNSGVLNIIP